MRKANYTIRTKKVNGNDWYIYECEKCGKEVDKLYAYKCVRGSMLCSECRYAGKADLYKDNKYLIAKYNKIARDIMTPEQAEEFERRING